MGLIGVFDPDFVLGESDIPYPVIRLHAPMLSNRLTDFPLAWRRLQELIGDIVGNLPGKVFCRQFFRFTLDSYQTL